MRGGGGCQGKGQWGGGTKQRKGLIEKKGWGQIEQDIEIEGGRVQ